MVMLCIPHASFFRISLAMAYSASSFQVILLLQNYIVLGILYMQNQFTERQTQVKASLIHILKL